MSELVTEAVINGRNLSEFSSMSPKSVYAPVCVEDVIIAIQDARSSGYKLRSISTGRNWGLGSSSSPEENCAVLHLGELRKIREINLEAGYAIVEPGVTQGELSEALKGSSRFINCTASSPETSLLGNMMDRGVGVRHQRVHDLLGLEIVLGSGELGHVGWWPCDTNEGINQHGLGPSLLQLFPQSNAAVATACVVRLFPVPQVSRLFCFSLPEKGLSDLVGFIKAAYADQLISGVAKVYDDGSNSIYGSSSRQLTAHLAVEGADRVVEAKLASLHNRYTALASVGAQLAGDPNQDVLGDAIGRLHQGDVSLNEDIVTAALGTSTSSADVDGRGWVMCLPFVPLNAQALISARSCVNEVCDNFGLEQGVTINAFDCDTVDLVICIRFSRKCAESTNSAHEALNIITKRLLAFGYRPYRLPSIQKAERIGCTSQFETQLARTIINAIDPDRVFASCQYLSRDEVVS